MKTSYTLCTGISKEKVCPLIATCDRWLPELDKTKTNYFEPIPYDEEKKKCSWYISEQDLINEGLK
jgi:hypothetical protein